MPEPTDCPICTDAERRYEDLLEIHRKLFLAAKNMVECHDKRDQGFDLPWGDLRVALGLPEFN